MYGISSGICEADKIKNTCLQSCFDNTHPGVYSHAGMLTQPKTKLWADMVQAGLLQLQQLFNSQCCEHQ